VVSQWTMVLKVAILLYADDVALIAEDEGQLQSMLDILSAWCSRWHLKVNPIKSAVVHFRASSVTRTTETFYCGDAQLPIVSQYRYLGLLFTETLNYETMTTCAAKAASRALGVIIAKSKVMGGMPYATFKKLYDTTVWPIMEYGACIWGTREHASVNAVQRRACQHLLGVGRFTPTAAINGDMGWTLPSERQWLAVSRVWYRCCTMRHDRVNSRIFRWGNNAADARSRNLCFRVRHQLDTLGLGHYLSDAPFLGVWHPD